MLAGRLSLSSILFFHSLSPAGPSSDLAFTAISEAITLFHRKRGSILNTELASTCSLRTRFESLMLHHHRLRRPCKFVYNVEREKLVRTRWRSTPFLFFVTTLLLSSKGNTRLNNERRCERKLRKFRWFCRLNGIESITNTLQLFHSTPANIRTTRSIRRDNGRFQTITMYFGISTEIAFDLCSRTLCSTIRYSFVMIDNCSIISFD